MVRVIDNKPNARREIAMEYWHRSLELDSNQPMVRRFIEKYKQTPKPPDAVLLGDAGSGD